jgi:glycosyltransferase involved in cell wall biosynthesis
MPLRAADHEQRERTKVPDGETTIIFSNVRADHLVQRHHYVARWRAKLGRSIWVDTLGSRNPRPGDLRRLGGERAGQSAGTLLPGVEVLKPRFVPLFGAPFYPINRRLLEKQLDGLGVDTATSTAWVYLPHPAILALLRERSWGRVVFDLCDDIDDMDVHPALRAGEAELLRSADVVFATAEALVEKARNVRGGDVARFGDRIEAPGKLRRILYVGAIYEWLDEDLLVAVAAARPDLELRIVGPVRRPLPRLKQMPNVSIPGPVAAERVPQEIAGAQLCMIPFRPGPLTEATDPLKLYEALIAGRPVLATALHQGERFAPAVRLESTAEGWIGALADLESGAWSFDGEALRKRVADEEDWRERFASMDRALSASPVAA